ELEIAVDIALEAGADDAELPAHLGAKLLLLQSAVLGVGEDRRADDDKESDGDEQVQRVQSCAHASPNSRQQMFLAQCPVPSWVRGLSVEGLKFELSRPSESCGG